MSIKPEELKPCPFCGSSKAFAMNAESSVFCFGCDACDARVYGISEKAAKKRWNTRAIPDTHRVVSVELLEKCVGQLLYGAKAHQYLNDEVGNPSQIPPGQIACETLSDELSAIIEDKP